MSAVVLLVLILPMIVSILLDIPAVQNYVVHKAADYASKRLETRVSIDRVDIGLFNRISVYGLYVEDYQRDTLLYAGRAKALVTNLGVFSNTFGFSYGDVEDAKLYIRETPDGQTNIKQIVDRLSKRKGKGNFRMTMKRVDVSNMELRIERLKHRNPEFGVDYGNMRLLDIHGRVDSLSIHGSAVSGRVQNISFRERSGFEAESVSGCFMVDKGTVTLADARVRAGASDLFIDRLQLAGADWTEYSDFIHKINISAVVHGGYLTSEDVGYFAPALRHWDMHLSQLDVAFDGTVDNFSDNVSDVVVNSQTRLSADISARGLPNVAQTEFVVDLHSLTTNASEVRNLAMDIANAKFPDKVADILGRCGHISLNGLFAGRISSFRTHGNLGTDVGSVGFNAVMQPSAGRRKALGATLSSRNLDIGKLLDNKSIGNADFVVMADGTFAKGSYDMNVNGNVSHIVFGGYDYRDISVDGNVADGDVSGRASIDDPALKFDLMADVGFGGEIPTYDMTMELHRADLKALGINRRDSVSLLSASVGLNAEGRIPDEINGELSIANAKYVYDSNEISSELMRVRVSSNEDLRSIKLNSNFADIVFDSRNDYSDVWLYIKKIISIYLPVLYSDGRAVADTECHKHSEHDEYEGHRYSSLSVLTKDFNPIADALSRGLQIADSSRVDMLLDPVCDKFRMRAKSDYVERNRMLVMSLKVNVSNDAESLTANVSADDLYLGFLHLPYLKVRGSANNNNIDVSGSFSDDKDEFSGKIGVLAHLRRNPVTKQGGVDLTFAPSYVKLGKERWNIDAKKISADSARIVVDGFAISNAGQALTVDGVASRSRRDSLTLRLKQFEISPITQVANSVGYDIKGRTDGFATVKSALKGSMITADIRVDSIDVNSIPVKALHLGSDWDFNSNRARIAVSTVAGRDTILRGYFDPSNVRYLVRMDTDSLDVALINPVLQGVISNTRGVAETHLVLDGVKREAHLNGDIAVRDMSTKIDYTGVTYSVPETVRINVNDNRFNVASARVVDPEGNGGDMSFDLNMNHLSNIAYELKVAPEKMMVLNTTQNNNDYFYGKVYASGRATIKGDKSGVNMDITATTDDNSEFFLPLSNSSDISMADFVTFEQGVKPDTTDVRFMKKMQFERRRKGKTGAGDMDIKMTINIQPNVMCQLVIDPTVGDIIKGRGEGTLNIEVNPKANIFTLQGTVTIVEGSYLFTLQNIINKKFIIDEGSTITWTGDPLDAMLDIKAVYKVKASLQPLLVGSVQSSNVPLRAVPVDCIINLNDHLSKPTVTFDVEVPNADPDVQSLVANALSTPESKSQQFLYLLVANSFISEAASSSANSLGVTATAASATGFELLSNQLSNWLSADNYNIVIRYRPKTELTSDELDFGFSTGLVDNRLLLEVEGNYLVDRNMAVNSNSNLMGEAYLTWLIDRAGNLRLRGFTHTIDRFDENQGLQETGIGIYYKESFNNLSDLSKRVRERIAEGRRRRAESREERRRRREEKAQQQSQEQSQLPEPESVKDADVDGTEVVN